MAHTLSCAQIVGDGGGSCGRGTARHLRQPQTRLCRRLAAYDWQPTNGAYDWRPTDRLLTACLPAAYDWPLTAYWSPTTDLLLAACRWPPTAARRLPLAGDDSPPDRLALGAYD